MIERLYAKPLDALREEWHAAIEQGETSAAAGVTNGVEAGTGYAGYRTASDRGFWVPATPPRALYTLDARLSRQGQYGILELKETIRFANNTGRPIERLALEYPVDICETLDVRVAGKPVAFIPPGEPPGSPALFALPSPAAPGDEVQLDVTFAARSPFPEKADSIPLVGWYPRLWWGFETHDDYDVALELPSEYTVGTSGRRNPETKRYTIRGAKTFGLFLGKGHKVMEADAGDVRIRAVHADPGEACARLLLETAVDVVTFYRERFGSYPYRTLTIVPGMDRPAGGYPMATALVAIHGQERMDEKPELHWRWITAHEIGHQYWGEHVLENDLPGWLWIGLGIYADREYVRARRLGLKKHRELMARYIEGVEQGLDTTLALTPEQYMAVDYDYNNVSIHGKGYSIVSAIAWLLGQETFDRVYRRCLDEFAGRRLGAGEFQAVCEEESGEDLAWFFDQWVGSNRYLSYEVAPQTCTKQNGRYVSHVRVQRAGTLQMPVPVVAYFEDGTAQLQRTDRLLDVNELTFESAAPLTRVRIDPEGELAMAGPPAGTAKAALAEAARKLPWTGAGKRALEVFHKAQEEKQEDADIWKKLGLTLYDGNYYPEALEAFQRTAEYAEKGSTWSFVSFVWQGHILDLLGRREEAVKCYKESLKRDTGTTMRHDQYGMQVNRRWVLQRLKTPFERK
jgi:tetratricopeptide (TPR) repeat protein